MKTIVSLSTFFCVLLITLACAKKPKPGFSTFKLDLPFDLKLNGSAMLDGDEFKLTFDALPEDSRCPKEVDCIQAGQARITLLANLDGSDRNVEYVWPASQIGNVTRTIGPFKVHLLDVSPYPVSGKLTKPEDYAIRLVVRKG